MNEAEAQKMAGKRLLLLSLLVLLLASFIASMIQNSGGRVSVQDIKIPTHNGQWVVADLYKPRSASSDNPAPLVVVIPVFRQQRSTSKKWSSAAITVTRMTERCGWYITK